MTIRMKNIASIEKDQFCPIRRFIPSMDAKGPSMDAKGPSIDAKSPSMDAKGPSMDAKRPSIDAKGRVYRCERVPHRCVDRCEGPGL